MRNRFLGALGAMAMAITVISLAAISVAAQAPSAAKAKTADKATTWTAPRTAWGEPDLQGVWANNNATPLERPKELEGRQHLSEDEVESLKQHAAELFNGDTDAAFGDSVFLAALRSAKGAGKGFTSTDSTGNYNHFWLVEREFDNRTSLITDPADGRIPPLTPEALKRETAGAQYRAAHPFDGPEDIPLSERCITRGVPLLTAGYNSYYQILQTPGYVALHMEMMHDPRLIPIDGRPHLASDTRQILGDSRGHWEGNTLVVETTNLTAKPSGTANLRVSTTERLKLIERFTRAGPDTINYEVTVDDPGTWTGPWSAMIPWKQTKGQIYEFACHEGNEAMVGTLGGTRVLERAAVDAAKKGSK